MKRAMMLATLAMAGLTGSAQAAIQTYDFTAVLNTVGSVNELVWSDSGEGIVAGTRVNKGDIIKGRVSFDDAAPLQPWGHGDPASGEAGTFNYVMGPSMVSLEYTFVGIGQHFASLGGSVSVENDQWGEDVFRVQAYGGPGPWHTNGGGFALIDSDGAVFGNGTIPKSLTLSDFDRPLFNANWSRGSDGGSILTSSTITELTLVSAVPEPATNLMLLSGLAIAGVAARRRSARA